MSNTKILYPTPSMKYEKEQVWFPLSEDILSWDDDFHNLMLRDHIRMVAYEAAIREVVKPGMTIVDVGTGTGILALWALEAGAKKVYAIEVNENRISQAKDRIIKAGYENKFEIFNALSYKVKLPERVDIIISEILGNLSDNEDMTPILSDAKKRFLKEKGLLIPRKVKTYIAPISSEKAYKQVKNKICRGINKKYKLQDLLNKLNVKNQFDLYYDCILPRSTYLSNPKVVKEFNFDGNDESIYKTKIGYVVIRAGIFTGFKGSFSAELSNTVVLNISDDNIAERKTADCWKHCYLPIENPVVVKKGDRIELTYSRSYPKKKSLFRQIYSWKGKVTREDKIIMKFEQEMK